MTNHAKAHLVIDELKFFSVIPIMRLFLTYGVLSVCFFQSSSVGLRLLKICSSIGLVHSFEKIPDIYLMDCPEGMHHRAAYYSHQELKLFSLFSKPIIDSKYSKLSQLVRNIINHSISSFAGDKLSNNGINLLNYAVYKHNNSTSENSITIFVSSYLRLFLDMNLYKYINKDGKVKCISQPFAVGSILYQWSKVILTLLYLSREMFLSTKNSKGKKNSIGTAAVWGVNNKMKNDFYWFNPDMLDRTEVTYFFDRPDYKLTDDMIEYVSKNGFNLAVFASRSIGSPSAKKYLIQGWVINEFLLYLSLSFISLFKSLFISWKDRFVITESQYVYLRASYLSKQLTAMNLAGLMHYSEASHDVYSLACEMSKITRFGIHWSILNGPDNCSKRLHHVFFFWGKSEVKIAEASGISSKCSVVVGSIVNDFSNHYSQDYISSQIFKLKKNGCKHVLTLFDSSTPAYKFYEDFISGKRPTLIVEIPPQHGKSIGVIELIAWISGKHPDLMHMFTSS